jgi:hypothetical protein
MYTRPKLHVNHPEQHIAHFNANPYAHKSSGKISDSFNGYTLPPYLHTGGKSITDLFHLQPKFTAVFPLDPGKYQTTFQNFKIQRVKHYPIEMYTHSFNFYFFLAML